MGLSLSNKNSKANADSHRYITLTQKMFLNEAFNAVLMASKKGKLENGIVHVAQMFENLFLIAESLEFRLNQTTANAAASIFNLGAKVTRTTTIETAVTQGVSESSAVSGAANHLLQHQVPPLVEVYGSDIGPLLGLIATTDDCLQTVTLIVHRY